MTVEELIEELKRFHPKDRVRILVQGRNGWRESGDAETVYKAGSQVVIESK
jgi:hypothetical protein